ncbi:MAG: MBL fold metallo-hydrolase [Planctomycetota bacterium]
MIKIVFLGTNGWYDTQAGNTVSILIQTPKYDIILDAGNGFTKIGKYLTFRKPVYLFLSHYHLDHIIGLHTLNKFNFRKGLYIIGPKGLKKMLNTLVQKPYTFPFSKLPYPTKVYEVKEGWYTILFKRCHCEKRDSSLVIARDEVPKQSQDRLETGSAIPLSPFTKGGTRGIFECRLLLHPVPTLGYRFQLDGKVITYCTDTGYCENAVRLARNADLLITECAYKRGMLSSRWPHLNPDEAARLAKTANAKKLMLTHFDAGLYKTIPERHKAQNQARETFPNAFAATDNIGIRI